MKPSASRGSGRKGARAVTIIDCGVGRSAPAGRKGVLEVLKASGRLTVADGDLLDLASGRLTIAWRERYRESVHTSKCALGGQRRSMKTATAKDLRVRSAALLDEVRRGQEVVITYRGKSVAVLAPVHHRKRKGLVPVGFGMWRERRAMQDVERWVNKLRAPRRARSSSTPTS